MQPSMAMFKSLLKEKKNGGEGKDHKKATPKKAYSEL